MLATNKLGYERQVYGIENTSIWYREHNVYSM